MKSTPVLCWVLASFQSLAAALTIAEINGNKFISPYSGKSVTNVTGLLIAKGPNGVWIRSTTPDDDKATSEAVYVFSNSVGSNLTVGDIIILDGKVSEYRSSASYIYLTEITSPKNVRVLSSGNTVTPLVIGKDTLSPPTMQYSSLDGGDIYSLPNAVANISEANPILDPTKYGLDFWESLSGELVTIRKPQAIKTPNKYGDTWVVGDWAVTGKNEHGGLTMSDKDSNPEAIVIGSPLDGSKNPTTSKMGDQFEDITGIVQQTFGVYNILPLTALKTTSSASASVSPTSLLSQGECKALTVGSYNVENMAPTSSHLPKIAAHIVDYLKTPDLMFVQEIQDNNGPTDDGVVDANATLTALVEAINTLSGVTYAFTDIDPVSDEDGGQPGGNIRVAYLYRPEVVSLYKPNPGGSNDATEVVPAQGKGKGSGGAPTLSFNPGRIDPANAAWKDSRKPLAAVWKAKGAKRPFYTVNVHWSSKGGGTSLHGDVRPPINGAVEARMAQANVTGSFIAKILALDPTAHIIAAGDFNEFSFVQPLKTFSAISKMVDIDEAANVPAEERYTYAYDMNSQALDHIFVSPALAHSKTTRVEHLHLNSWAAYDDVVSDHDPSIALLDVCGC
ncbi:Endonuclease/ exonuclease [Achaetomium macrosporum]|uniref:Endonuclease/ exonuclease n=1 Tax=Achaetomium macrosporum TaxID=79813 RepID=A0AAN7CB89_9PEZI|nr:Endonuclease/ exonuclease [Achaetomium macrosporum]